MRNINIQDILEEKIKQKLEGKEEKTRIDYIYILPVL